MAYTISCQFQQVVVGQHWTFTAPTMGTHLWWKQRHRVNDLRPVNPIPLHAHAAAEHMQWWSLGMSTYLFWKSGLMESVFTNNAKNTLYSPRLDRTLSRGVAKRTLRDIKLSETELTTKLYSLVQDTLSIRGRVTTRKTRQLLSKRKNKLHTAIDALVQPQLIMEPAKFRTAEYLSSKNKDNWFTIWPVLCTRQERIRDTDETVYCMSLIVLGVDSLLPIAAKPCQLLDVGLFIRQHAIERAAQRLSLTEHDDLVRVFCPTLMTMLPLSYFFVHHSLPAGTASYQGQYVLPIADAGAAVVEPYDLGGKLQVTIHTVLAPDQLTLAQRNEVLWWRRMVQENAGAVTALLGQCAFTVPHPELANVVLNLDAWAEEHSLLL